MDERIFSKLGEWQDFDPGWLVTLATEQLPRHPQVAEALKVCLRCRPESRSYVRFIDASRPHKTDTLWYFAANITLRDPQLGEIVLDVLTNGRIGGFEITERLVTE